MKLVSQGRKWIVLPWSASPYGECLWRLRNRGSQRWFGCQFKRIFLSNCKFQARIKSLLYLAVLRNNQKGGLRLFCRTRLRWRVYSTSNLMKLMIVGLLDSTLKRLKTSATISKVTWWNIICQIPNKLSHFGLWYLWTGKTTSCVTGTLFIVSTLEWDRFATWTGKDALMIA